MFFAGEAVYPKYNSTVHAAFESGQRTANHVLKTEARKIAIIGAGMSGLSAAHKLSEQARQVSVFEARDRIGGRVWTDGRLGVPLDLGASWIHGVNGNPLSDLADQAGQTRATTEDDSYIIRGRGNRLISDSEAPAWLNEVVSIQSDAGADESQVNMLAYLFERGHVGDEVIFPDGYAAIFEALRGAYSIELSTVVRRLTRANGGVIVGFAERADEEFDAVIVTLPLGTLKKKTVQFNPPLPRKKQDAIARLGMGTLDKVYLLFDDVFWDRDVTWIATPENDLPKGQFNLWLNLHRYIDHPVVVAFNGGSPALDLAGLSDEDVVGKALHALERAYPT